MAAVDRYAGVSNANMHLRAAVDGDLDVLVPHPPEWRGGITGARSWLPRANVHRQEASGERSEALGRPRAALTSPAAP
jgi:hypothetical protein